MIYVTGDTHGEISFLKERNLSRLKSGDTLIICGDFGFLWDNSKSEQKALKTLSKKKYTILFIDGTHENFDMLSNLSEVEAFESTAKKVSDNIYYLKRGNVYTVENKKIFAFGGGVCPENDKTSDYDVWYEKAFPTLNEMADGLNNLAAQNFCVDYIITHEAPSAIKKMLDKSSIANDVNFYLDSVRAKVKYQKWIFGYLHKDVCISEKTFGVFCDVLPVTKTVKPRSF